MTLPIARPLRIAIVGCGQIADAHLQELSKIPSVEVVATCDRHLDLAMQAAQRFNVPHFFQELKVMLHATRPDIVHIATPAQTHAALAHEAMIAGAHVYVEKPLALDEREVRGMLATAQAHNRIVCAGHDQLFDPSWLALRQRIDNGEIGEVRHVESILGYPISGQFGHAVRADPRHWVRQLPGGLFQNTMSHPLYRITDYLTDARPGIVSSWWEIGDFGVPTELFVHLRGQQITGVLTFSTSIAAQRITRVHGAKGSLEIDLDAQSIVRVVAPSLPGALAKLGTPWRRRRESGRVLRRNIGRFLRSDIHYFAGMRTLFERFQNAVRTNNQEWPIRADEMLRTTRIMDQIFETCRTSDASRERSERGQVGLASGIPSTVEVKV